MENYTYGPRYGEKIYLSARKITRAGTNLVIHIRKIDELVYELQEQEYFDVILERTGKIGVKSRRKGNPLLVKKVI